MAVLSVAGLAVDQPTDSTLKIVNFSWLIADFVVVLTERWKQNKVQMQVSMSLLLVLTSSPEHDCFAKVVMDFYCTAASSGLNGFVVCSVFALLLLGIKKKQNAQE